MEGERLNADLMIGNNKKNEVVPEVIALLAKSNQPGGEKSIEATVVEAGIHIPAGQKDAALFEEMGTVVQQSDTRGVIKIQDGCNNFCSYCAIPLARGRVRSRQPESIIAEAQALAAAGFQEIVLTGIHICSYGTEPGFRSRVQNLTGSAASATYLLDLCDKLAEIRGIERLRLGSLEPKSVTEAFARQFGANPILCSHVHLSLQSGSDDILKKMGRRYTTTDYAAAVAYLRAAVPDILFTTDIIVGFPGESEANHAESLAFCKAIGFSKIHTFRYSRREGTRAADMPNQVPGEIAEQRSQDFLDLSEQQERQTAEKLCGTIQDVLLEQKRAGIWSGYTPGYVQVFADLGEAAVKAGDIVPLRMGAYSNVGLTGEWVN